MRRTIARRPVTGARRIPGRRRPPAGHAPLRRPLALLYRRRREAGAAAPAAVRAADGRAVPLAPRLQIALHLSIALREQHHAPAAPAGHLAREHTGRATRHERFILTPTAFRERPLRDGAEVAHAAHRARGRHVAVRAGAPPIALRAGTAARDKSSGPAAGRLLFAAAREGRERAAAVSPDTFVIGLGAAAEMRCGLRPSHANARRTSQTALRTRAAGLAGRRPGESAPRLVSARGTRGRLGQPASWREAGENSSTSGSHAAAGSAPPLLWARPSAAASAAQGAVDPALRPPPLDYRRPAPSAPPVQPEARPVATTAPSAPAIDLEAVSRDVIRRIEQRLRVERERRGRS